MPLKSVAAIIVAGLAAATGAAVFLGYDGPHADQPGGFLARMTGGAPAAFEICLKSPVPMFAGAVARCFAPEEISALRSEMVLDAEGEPMSVGLSHPTDYSRSIEPVSNCATYDARIAAGWYAISTREMRREAWFKRACGTLSLLSAARRPDVSYFEGGASVLADFQSVAGNNWFAIGVEAQAGALESVEHTGDYQWEILSPAAAATVQEIAHADFTGDGRGDILVFVSVQASDGAVASFDVGLLDKPVAGGPVRLVAQ